MSDYVNEPLSRLAMPHLGRALRDRKRRIQERWEREVRQSLPDADDLTRKEVQDSLPEVLEGVAKALERADAQSVRELAESTKAHGETRFHQSYNLNELIIEYRILRLITVEEVERELAGKMTITDAMALNTALDIMLHQTIVTFVAYQQNQIREASEWQSRYVAFVSHDLRNNLNDITLTLELLLRTLRAARGFEEQVADIEAMKRSILDTVAGMERLLYVERARNTAALHTAPVDLARLLDEIVLELGPRAQRKNLSLIAKASADLLPVQSDRELIRIVLQNLVGNSIKYSVKGTILLTAGPRPEGGWIIAVSDQGPGIPADRLDKLFKAFERGETHGQSGTGLGLAIAAQAAKTLGAKLTVDSIEGKGATFRLLLP